MFVGSVTGWSNVFFLSFLFGSEIFDSLTEKLNFITKNAISTLIYHKISLMLANILIFLVNYIFSKLS